MSENGGIPKSPLLWSGGVSRLRPHLLPYYPPPVSKDFTLSSLFKILTPPMPSLSIQLLYLRMV